MANRMPQRRTAGKTAKGRDGGVFLVSAPTLELANLARDKHAQVLVEKGLADKFGVYVRREHSPGQGTHYSVYVAPHDN